MNNCGDLVTVPLTDNRSIQYVYSKATSVPKSNITLLLIPGGGGHLKLNEKGCPRDLFRNPVIRSIPHFNSLGASTALLNTPTDQRDVDGFGGTRFSDEHMQDLAAVIKDLRQKDQGALWAVGHSLGTLSTAALAVKKMDVDGIVLMSAMMTKVPGAKKTWASQMIFDLSLESISMPVLMLGREDDTCHRSPAVKMKDAILRIGSLRKKELTLRPANVPNRGDDPCGATTGHGFIGQDQDIAERIMKFIAAEGA